MCAVEPWFLFLFELSSVWMPLPSNVLKSKWSQGDEMKKIKIDFFVLFASKKESKELRITMCLLHEVLRKPYINCYQININQNTVNWKDIYEVIFFFHLSEILQLSEMWKFITWTLVGVLIATVGIFTLKNLSFVFCILVLFLHPSIVTKWTSSLKLKEKSVKSLFKCILNVRAKEHVEDEDKKKQLNRTEAFTKQKRKNSFFPIPFMDIAAKASFKCITMAGVQCYGFTPFHFLLLLLLSVFISNEDIFFLSSSSSWDQPEILTQIYYIPWFSI